MSLPADFVKTYGPWALVTGASSGIGAEFARQLAATSLNVVVVARRQERLDTLASELRDKHSVQTKVIVADLATEQGWKAVVSGTEDLDVGLLVNNAGVELHGSFFKDDVDKHLNLISVNCSSVTALAHAIGRRLADKGRGGIIFTSSMSCIPSPFWASYCASKGFVSNLSISLRSELKKNGVNVLALEAGLVASEMSDNVGKTLNFKKTGQKKMPTADCVRVTLRSLARGRAKVTPGVNSKVMAGMMTVMPEGLRLNMQDRIMRKQMDESLLKYA